MKKLLYINMVCLAIAAFTLSACVREFPSVNPDGSVGIDFSAPCEFLDEDSRLCRGYDERFTRCERCRRLTPAAALFGKHLPPTCGYVLKFR